MAFFRTLFKILPTLLTAFLLALAVWILAVTSTDPVEKRAYPSPVPLEIVGQDSGLLITSSLPESVTVVLSAPQSTWSQLTSMVSPIRAVADLSGLGSGVHSVPVQVQVGLRPVEIITYSPDMLSLTLEKLETRQVAIELVQRGSPAVGYQVEKPGLSQEAVLVSGPESLVNKVATVRAILDLNQVTQEINRSLVLQALDANEVPVAGITLTPERVNVAAGVVQRGGYRNVVVKVVTTGQVTNGYRLTNISAYPPTVTVFSTNPLLVDNLPGYIEAQAVDLTNVKDDVDLKVELNLPDGISVVGDSAVQVTIGVAAIESSLTMANLKIDVKGLDVRYSVKIAPMTVDVIISGPLPMLDRLAAGDVKVIIDLTGMAPGTYQLTPVIELAVTELRVESILPGSVEVTILSVPPTPTP